MLTGENFISEFIICTTKLMMGKAERCLVSRNHQSTVPGINANIGMEESLIRFKARCKERK
jgi:hypothetical protein